MVIVVLLLLAAGAVSAYLLFFRELPPTHFASDEEHFLYGSIGTEDPAGVPYWIWLVLPRVFPDLLPGPGGYASIGIVGQEGHELPVGFSKRTIGFERVGINCAMCHAGTYRLKASDNPTIVATAPSHQVSPQQYLRFLFACANDSRFNAKTILAEIDKNYRLSWLDRQLYRFALVPLTRRSLLKQQRVHNIYGWMKDNPPWGRGRIDPFNPIKYQILNQPVDNTIGNSDMVPLWNQKQHQAFALHWDGLNGNLTEVVLTSAIGDGASKKWVDADLKKSDSESSLKRIQKFITEAQAPKYPLRVNAGLAAKGKVVYDKDCASCHAFGGAQTGKVEPVSDPNLMTDRHRIDMWTANAAKAYNDYAAGYSWKFASFVKPEGYVNVPLDGIWLRAPYLHNGSVPTLADLLEEPQNRPKAFYRGYDVIDPLKVGFVTDGPEAERIGFRYDINVPGNGNGGHLWGTKLSGDDKHALIEYMKTL
jgi:cytochrome c2